MAPITIAALKGLLESVSDRVNMVNAPVIAQERGIKVVESKVSRPQDFASGISLRLRGTEDRTPAAATGAKRESCGSTPMGDVPALAGQATVGGAAGI